jgi:hypothetical protein
MPMDREELRSKLMRGIDDLLSKTLLVRGDNRMLLSALRGYLPKMPHYVLDEILTHVARDASDEPQE